MTENRDSMWKEPSQARSREKVERILDAALDLALQSGSLDYKMTEVAKAAGVAVGTLYQFFPSRSALTARLFAREMAPIDASMAGLFEAQFSLEKLSEQVRALMLQHVAWVNERPGLSIIWAAPRIDPDIEAADFENTRQNAATLADLMTGHLPERVERSHIEATALLICHLWSSVIRLSCLLESPQREAIVLEYADMITAHGAALARA